jgi:3-oxoacyl-[acyl-carrier protein] reductase
MIDPGLQDKVVLVTGANNPHGIGAATAEAFAAQGASVFITFLRSRPERAEFGVDAAAAETATSPGEEYYRARNAEAPDTVLRRLRAHGGSVGSVELDLADPGNIPLLFDRVESALGPVDILVGQVT